MAPVTLARDLFDLTGEVALVTGASSGLGARFAEVLAAHGAKLVLAARRKDRIAALAARLGRAHALALDVTQPKTFAAAFAEAESVFGPVTLLINNAGVADDGKFLDIDAAEWERVRQTNVDAVWHLSQLFAKRLIAAGKEGAIINIASILGYRVTPGAAAYCVSKAAVLQMTNALALELARHKIRVNAIAPGYIVTEMTKDYLGSATSAETRKHIPMRRTGDPSDLDGALLLLASKRASAFMTGSTIVADGGHMTAFW
jgi:NAD(P)-dependent dehydrogenase (short-subunit alcohol dehydrogenase family)